MPIFILPSSRTLSYHFDEEPNGGPVVLLANSLCVPFTVWHRVRDILNQSGFRTLRYDQPGHGQSSVPEDLSTTSFKSLAKDVRDLLKNLNIQHLHAWIGVSMGAATGFYFVTQNPQVVKKFVACDTISCSAVNAGIDDPFGPRVESARREGSMDKLIQGTLKRWLGKSFLEKNIEESSHLKELMSHVSLDGFETCCHALWSESFDIRPLFSQVGMSVEDALCIVGEKDANLPETMKTMSEEVGKGFTSAGRPNNVELVVIKDAGHVCFIDGFEQFIQTVLSFLNA
ncbi:hypothetical protein V2G26_009949 [Clonostachys chloroleuca]|uniref:AB hydrolase-1 domain-containing protein n=1 Tax=Clonostachys chloroleuca TaxID=1926264 RepID=A0AA35PYN4_9HYPO|nr:unnamed protein product [Clonostachys chloroleuca]